MSAIVRQFRDTPARLLTGDPDAVEIDHVAEYQPSSLQANTLYLVPDEDALRHLLVHVHLPTNTGFLISEELVVRIQPTWPATFACVMSVPRLRLDLSARVQRLLDTSTIGIRAPGALTRARQDLVEDLVLGRFQDPRTLLLRAHALDVPLESARCTLLVGFENFERFYLQRQSEGEEFFQEIKRQIEQCADLCMHATDTRAVVVPHAEGALALLPGDPETFGLATAAGLKKALRFIPVSVAAGNVKTSFVDLATSYQEARLALQLRSKLRFRGRFIAFSQITTSALLHHIERSADIASLLVTELSALTDGEYGKPETLIASLAAYFDAGTSLKRASDALGIHPKTLRYRLDRIEDLLGPGVLDGEKRLLYHLSAKYYLWLDS